MSSYFSSSTTSASSALSVSSTYICLTQTHHRFVAAHEHWDLLFIFICIHINIQWILIYWNFNLEGYLINKRKMCKQMWCQKRLYVSNYFLLPSEKFIYIKPTEYFRNVSKNKLFMTEKLPFQDILVKDKGIESRLWRSWTSSWSVCCYCDALWSNWWWK